MTEFSAKVNGWVRQTKERQKVVYQYAAQLLVSEMQKPTARGGNMPVDTGLLRNSLMASTTAMPSLRDIPSATADQVSLVILGLEADQPLYLGYTANYARARHYMSTDKPGGFWRDLAAQNWQRYVNTASNELRARQLRVRAD